MLSAPAHDVSNVESRSPAAGRYAPGTPGSIITLPTGQLVLIVAPGIYQALSSGRVTRTDSAH